MIEEPTIAIRRLLQALVLGSLLVVALLLGSDRGEATQMLLQSAGDTYAQQCAPCHGVAGEGTDFGSPLIDSSLPADDRIEIITNGNGAMPAFGPTLSANQIAQLAVLWDPMDVSDIYFQQCAPCHGVSGEGGVGPSLTDSTMSDAELLVIIRDGSPIMPGYGPTLTPEQIDALVAYSAGFVDRDTEPPDTSTGDVEAGAIVYSEQCASCHGADGEGGAGPALQTSSTPQPDQFQIIRDGERGMPAFGLALSEEELEAVTAFSVSLQEAAPDQPQLSPVQLGARVYADNCASCHGADAGGGAGPDLRATSLTGDELAGVVSHGRGTMPGFAGRLEADDIGAVVVLLQELAAMPDTDPPPSDGSPIAQGAKLFTENCSGCHGPDASGGVGPALKTSTLTGDEMQAIVRNGSGAMPGFSVILSDADTNTIVAYLEATKSAATDGGVTPSPSAVGEEIFLASCATCHMLDGSGGVGPALAGTELTPNEIISQVFGGHPQGMPAFEGVLDPVQVQEVSRYIGTLEGQSSSSTGLIGLAIILVVVVGGAIGLWYGGFLDRWLGRSG